METGAIEIPWTLIGILAVIAAAVLIPLVFRRVVSPNEVHTVQAAKKRQSYGKDLPGGNTYYDWPAWIPIIGVQTVVLPLSVFEIPLDDYDAYDIDRVPFVVDVVAFFRIADPNKAAERVESMRELHNQLDKILRGAARAVLAKSPIDEIMVERAKYGKLFTEEVDRHLQAWGVENVKSIELMDVRDPSDGSSHAVKNIMDKKKSRIERESRVEVAGNMKTAAVAEINAQREVDVQKEQARQAVGERTAQANKNVGIANEKANQEIKEQQRETAERDQAVNRVNLVRAQEITRDQQIVAADQDKQTAIIRAEGDRDAEKRRAEGILAVGSKEADVIKAKKVAEVQGDITLAEVIAELEGYQEYLTTIRDLERGERVGMEQAKALQAAEIRVFADGSGPDSGLDNVMDLFSATGGKKLGKMLETFAQTPMGEEALAKLGMNGNGNARPGPSA